MLEEEPTEMTVSDAQTITEIGEGAAIESALLDQPKGA